jgi:hypothetical protein
MMVSLGSHKMGEMVKREVFWKGNRVGDPDCPASGTHGTYPVRFFSQL